MTEAFFVMKFEELNVLAFDIAGSTTPKEAEQLFEDVLFDAYVDGFADIFDGRENETVNYDKMLATVRHEYNGVSIYETMQKYVEAGDIDGIRRLLESEYHRVFNQAQFDTATERGYTRKTWVTVGDDVVRDTHEYIDGVSVDINAEFMTYDGDRARFPGDFSLAQNNANCRCWVEYSE